MTEETAEKMISVFGREDTDTTDRGLFSRIENLMYGAEAVPADKLKQRLENFLSVMRDVIMGMPYEFGDFQLDSVTLTAEVSANGKVSLLGTGGELAGKGGLTFNIKRAPQPAEPATTKKDKE